MYISRLIGVRDMVRDSDSRSNAAALEQRNRRAGENGGAPIY